MNSPNNMKNNWILHASDLFVIAEHGHLGDPVDSPCLRGSNKHESQTQLDGTVITPYVRQRKCSPGIIIVEMLKI